MINHFKSYSIWVLCLILIGLVFGWKSDRKGYESKLELLSLEIESKTNLVFELHSNINQMQLESERLRKQIQFVSELNLKYKSDLVQIEKQFEIEMDAIRKLRQNENESVRVWVDTDVPADAIGLLKYARAEVDNPNYN